MISAALGLLLTAGVWAPVFPPDAVASWVLSPCEEVLVAPEQVDRAEVAETVRRALETSRACRSVRSSAEAWPPGWTLEQERLVRTQSGTSSQLIIVRFGTLVFVDGQGKEFAQVDYAPSTPIASHRAPSSSSSSSSFSRFEAFVMPLGYHLNPSYSQHYSPEVGFLFRPWWFFAVGASFLDTVAYGDGPAVEQIQVERVEPQFEGMMRLNWAAQVVVEATPIKWLLTPYVRLGAGFGGTQVVLKPKTTGSNASPETTGDIGTRAVFSWSLGVRCQPLEHLTLRAGVRGVVVPGGASSINGCSEADLIAMDNALRAGRALSDANVGSGCNTGAWGNGNDVPLARSRVTEPGGGLLHLIYLDLGAGFAF